MPLLSLMQENEVNEKIKGGSSEPNNIQSDIVGSGFHPERSPVVSKLHPNPNLQSGLALYYFSITNNRFGMV